MLNDKDNQVFLDYLAGGRNAQVAMEREANAQSNGVLSVAARNLADGQNAQVAVESGANAQSMTARNLVEMGGDEVRKLEDIKNELQVIATMATEVSNLPHTLREFKKEFSEIMDLKIDYGKKEQELELKKRKQNMQLLLEEAEVEQRCKAIREGRIDVVGAGDNSNMKRQKLQRSDSVASSVNSGYDYDWSSSDDDDNDNVEVHDLTGMQDEDDHMIDESHPLEYDKSKEDGLDADALAVRKDMWNKLADMHNYPCNDEWLLLVESNAAQKAYEAQLVQRIQKYEADQEKSEQENAKVCTTECCSKFACPASNDRHVCTKICKFNSASMNVCTKICRCN